MRGKALVLAKSSIYENLGGNMQNKGLFISFEGIDGSGKSAMMRKVAKWLVENGFHVFSTREPGGTHQGRELRKMLLHSEVGGMDDVSETLLFALDRAFHCQRTIKPALTAGKVVLSDRFSDSTLAYQGGGRGMDISALQSLNSFATSGLEPDITILLDIDPEVAQCRLSDGKDRMEQENIDFFCRVAKAYRQLASENPTRIKVIDASSDMEAVFKDILTVIQPLLQGGENNG